jgi:spore coat protein A
LLKLGVLGGSALLLQNTASAQTLQSPPVTPFLTPLAIPPVLAPVSSDECRDYYDIAMEQTQVEIIPGTFTTIWAYNGLYPGPTIKARKGRPIVIRHRNHLPEPTSVHLHGGHTPPSSDGHPYDLIPPGGAKNYHYPNNQLPCILWYHDHAVDVTGRHVYMGLAGFYILTDDLEDSLPLPTGANDVPLLIQDRLFNADGSLNYPFDDQTILTGVLGDRILVNGVIQPYFEVSARKFRFRIVNGSNTRFYRLALSSGDPLIQVGSDGGLLSQPVTRSTITIAPAERVDIVIDFSGYSLDTHVILTNQLGQDSNLTNIMEFRVVRDELDDSSIPNTLREVESIPETSAVRTRSFTLSERVINGRRLLQSMECFSIPVASTLPPASTMWKSGNLPMPPMTRIRCIFMISSGRS